jgi:hypothetical protein
MGVLPCAGATQAIPTVVMLGFVVVGAAGTLGATNTAPLPPVE